MGVAGGLLALGYDTASTEGRVGRSLTSEESDFLTKNGYVVVKGFATKNECNQLQKRIEQLADEFDPNAADRLSPFSSHEEDREKSDDYFLTSGDKIRFFWEPHAMDENGKLVMNKRQALNKVGHALHVHDDVFRSFVYDTLRPCVESVGFKQPIPLQTMYICKSQRAGGEVTAHQDSSFLYTEPLSTHGLWLSVHQADESNGCLWVIPGSHSIPLYKRFVSDGKQAVLRTHEHKGDLPLEGGVPLPTEIGDLVILHGNVVHWSEANMSDRPRHAYMLHVIDGACHYPEDNWLQYPPGKPFPSYDRVAASTHSS